MSGMGFGLLAAAFAAPFLTLACAADPEPLMDPPVVIALGSAEGVPAESVLYATIRARDGQIDEAVSYGVGTSEEVRFGSASVRLAPAALDVLSTIEHFVFPWHDLHKTKPAEAGDVLAELEVALAATPAQDLLVYVHGTKVAFDLPISRAAELQHFGGRRFATIAFDWPAHSNIFAYAFGPDRQRAIDAAHPLAQLLDWLAEHTTAERIHVLAYSAGCETATFGLAELRAQYPELNATELRKKLRIANTVFACGDIEVDQFIHNLPAIHELAGRVTVLVSDHDTALLSAERWMGGRKRLGDGHSEAELLEQTAILTLPRFQIIDVSLGSAARGFDIDGHHYWYRHPWVSADMLMLLLTDRDAGERGLARGPWHQVWMLPADYPSRLRAAARALNIPVQPESKPE